MKLITTIEPRADGTVRVTGSNGQAYVFERDKAGELACDIADEATIVRVLGTGEFYPANAEDMDAADDLMRAAGGVEDLDGEGDDPDSLDDDLASDPNAAPIEANTLAEVAEDAAAEEKPAPAPAPAAKKAGKK